ncbi:DUF2752 domain-containing protein [uncultured Dysosmobacter sp.]|uniref:DUF2752 domain-containing protein n=1 Tax=uncultured Dysosmobacter sp. TaxID=2591384 RepID=UPI0026056007|nr:DUF2752 domain-containing protein [uncultured Dysosmobacter sp.]
MAGKPMTDREAYPAAWLLLSALGAAFLFWKYGLGAPAVSGCWIWTHWRVYCPGCGGTRAVTALAHGHLLRALYFHPAVPVTAGLGGVYLVSQTIWRFRGRRGWVLRYDQRWPAMLVGLFLANCAVRNILWLGFGIPI